MPVASDDVVWLDVLPSMGRFRKELETQSGTSADSAGKKAGGAFTGAFSSALKIGAVVGGALAAAAAGNFMKEAITEASNLGESLNAVNVTFGKNAEGINELGRNAAQSFGLSQSQFNSLAVQFSSFATTIAGEGGNVTGTMKDLATRGSDFASVMNLDVNEAMRLFQSGLAGETEPLRAYGIDLSAAAVENHALAKGIAQSGTEMTEQQKVQARYSLLMEQTSKTQGDFANTSDSLANSQRILGANWDNIQATVGSKVLPTLERFSGWVLTTGLPALQSFGGWAQDNLLPIFGNIGDFFSNSFLPKLRDLASVVLPALWGAFQTGAEVMGSVVGFFREHDTALTVLKGTVAVVGGFMAAAWVTQGTVAVINAAKSVGAWFATATASTTSATIQSRSTAQIVVGWLWASTQAMLHGLKIAAVWTAQIVASAVTGAASFMLQVGRVVGGWVLMAAQATIHGLRVAAVWTGTMLASAVTGAAAFMVQVGRVVAGWVLMGAQSLLQAGRMAAAWFIALGPIGWVIAAVIGLVALIIANWDTVVRWTTQAWTAVRNFVVDAATAIWSWVVEKFTWLKDAAISIFTTVRDVVMGIWNGFRDAVIAAALWIWDRVVWYFTTLWNSAVFIFTTIRDAVMWVWNNFRDGVIAVAQWIWDQVKQRFENLKNNAVAIWTWLRDTVVGVWTGFRDTVVSVAQNVWDWIVQRFNSMRDGVVDIFQGLVDTVRNIWNGVKQIAADPINFVIGTVLNGGLFKAFNSIIDTLGLNKDWKLKDLPLVRLAAGGRVPGHSPTSTADNIPAMLTAGEYVLPVKATQRLKSRFGGGFLESLRQGLPGYATGGLVALGRRLQGMGATVSRHPAFGGAVRSGHGKSSLHYQDRAIDVNTRPGTSAQEQRELDPMAALARSLGFRTIWRTTGHFNHLHIDDANGPSLGQTGGEGGGGGLGGLLGGLWDSVTGVWDSVKNSITGPINDFKARFGDSTLIKTAAEVPGKMAGMAWDKIKSKVQSMWDSVTDFFGGDGGERSATPQGVGVERWRETVRKALTRLGLPTSLDNTTLRRMKQESGGNPRAINNWDINAKRGTPSKGLMQVIDPTFAANRDRGLVNDIWDPLANIVASMKYALKRYGSLPAAYNRPGGYALGGEVGLFDDGGLWPNGGLGINLTGGVERVLTPPQDDYFRRFVDHAEQASQGNVIGELHLHEVQADMSEAIGTVNHWARVYERGGRYVPTRSN